MESKIDEIMRAKFAKLETLTEEYQEISDEIKVMRITAPKIKNLSRIQKHILLEAKTQYEMSQKPEQKKIAPRQSVQNCLLPVKKKEKEEVVQVPAKQMRASFAQKTGSQTPVLAKEILQDTKSPQLDKGDVQRKPPIPKFGKTPLIMKSEMVIMKPTKEDEIASRKRDVSKKITAVNKANQKPVSIQTIENADKQPEIVQTTEVKPAESVPVTMKDLKSDARSLSKRGSRQEQLISTGKESIANVESLKKIPEITKPRLSKAVTVELQVQNGKKSRQSRRYSQERTSGVTPEIPQLDEIANQKVRRLSKVQSHILIETEFEEHKMEEIDKLNANLSKISEAELPIVGLDTPMVKRKSTKEDFIPEPLTPTLILTQEVGIQESTIVQHQNEQQPASNGLFECDCEAIASTFHTELTLPDSYSNLDDLNLLDLNDKMFMIEELENSFEQTTDASASVEFGLNSKEKIIANALMFIGRPDRFVNQRTFIKIQAAEKIDILDRKIAIIDETKDSFVKVL